MLQKIYQSAQILFLSCFIHCGPAQTNKDLTFSYCTESINNYRIEFQLNPDSTYKIAQFNYFFNRFRGEATPAYQEGKLTRKEYELFIRLISKCRLEKMKDSYGFNRSDAGVGIVSIIELRQNNQSKYVTVNYNANEQLPGEFNRLVAFTGNFISEKMERDK